MVCKEHFSLLLKAQQTSFLTATKYSILQVSHNSPNQSPTVEHLVVSSFYSWPRPQQLPVWIHLLTFQIVFLAQIPRNRISRSEDTGFLEPLEFRYHTDTLRSPSPCRVWGPLGALSRLAPKVHFKTVFLGRGGSTICLGPWARTGRTWFLSPWRHIKMCLPVP